MKGCPQLKYLRKIRDCKSRKKPIDFTTTYWACHWHERIGNDGAEMKVCEATARETGEKLATQVFICKDQDFSADSNCTQKTLNTKPATPASFLSIRKKKHQVKGSIKFVKTRECSSVSASSITAGTAGNAELGFSWVINTFYI